MTKIIINPGLPTQFELDDKSEAVVRRVYDRNRCTCPRHGTYDSGRTGWNPTCSEHGTRGQWR